MSLKSETLEASPFNSHSLFISLVDDYVHVAKDKHGYNVEQVCVILGKKYFYEMKYRYMYLVYKQQLH